MNKGKQIIQDLLAEAGITINGIRAYDSHIHDERLYQRVIQKGALGLGEAYMDGWRD